MRYLPQNRFIRNACFVASMLLVVALSTLFVQPSSVLADPCPKSADINNPCIDQNYQDILKTGNNISAKDYRDAINRCADTEWVVGGGGGSRYLSTGADNCSNAIRSCFEHQIDTRACTDGDSMAMVSQCNLGNVSSGGDCGLDQKIADRNAYVGGEDFDTNVGIYADRIQKQKDDVCGGLGSVSEIEACEKKVADQVAACYGEHSKSNGGQGGWSAIDQPYSDSDLTNCLISKSDTDYQCAARHGNWDEATKKCTPPPPSANQTCEDGSAPNADTGKCPDGSTPGDKQPITPNADPDNDFESCGEAETTLISCKQSDCPGSSGAFEGAPVIGCVLRFAIQALTVIIGIAAVGGIAWEALQYARAQDDQSTVSNARNRIRDIVIGLIVYVFMIAVINWLVPGTVIQ